MAINTLNATGAASTSVASSAAATTPKAADEAQTRFMKLLVAQLKNQDPMNPMDNAEMTSQIAQLNMVTGINQLNATVNSMASSLQANQSLQSASLLGRSVLVPGNNLQLSQGRAELGIEFAQDVQAVQLTIRNSSGVVVATRNTGSQSAGLQNLVWDGVTDAGGLAPDGAYRFEVKALQQGQAISPAALTLAQVSSVSITGGAVSLSVAGVGQVGLSDVRQIR